MDIRRYEFVLEAKTALAHHEEVIGNAAVHMRRKMRMRDGSFARIPILTADTMRHGLREAAAYATLDAAGMLGDGVAALSEGAMRLLFTGGMVTGRGDASAVKLDEFRVMCELVPPLGLLGGCADNRVIPGRVQVDDAILICDETTHLIPEWATAWVSERGAIDTHRAHVEEVQRVRMDPMLDPGKRRLLTDGAQVTANTKLLASESASATGDAIEKDANKSTMMPRRFETVVAGSLFFWAVQATTHSELDVDTFDTMCATFLAQARVGGKRGTGHGHIAPLVANQIAVLRPADAHTGVDFGALAKGKGVLFREHVASRKDRVREFLQGVNA